MIGTQSVFMYIFMQYRLFYTHVHVHAAFRCAGTIRTNAVLDRESKPFYWLTIMAADHGTVPRSSIAEVYVRVDDVNDNKPRTELPVYYPEVLENSGGVCAAIPESALLKLASNDLEANMIESYFECGPLCRAVCGFRFESE